MRHFRPVDAELVNSTLDIVEPVAENTIYERKKHEDFKLSYICKVI